MKFRPPRPEKGKTGKDADEKDLQGFEESKSVFSVPQGPKKGKWNETWVCLIRPMIFVAGKKF